MKNKKNTELAVCGLAAVKSLGKEHPERIKRFYYEGGRAGVFGDLCKYLAKNKIPYNKVETEDLEKLCGSVHHQGVVAMIDESKPIEVTKAIVDSWILHKEKIILLDRIGNANNLGAIVRSAAFFGIHHIILPMHESQSMITTSSYRVAQGGMEYVAIYSLRSIIRFLQEIKGKITRVGTDVRSKMPVKDLSKVCKDKATLLILGNEEQGISSLVKENCDYLTVIPSAFMLQNPNEENWDIFPVESLNVAQAASVILYEMSKES